MSTYTDVNTIRNGLFALQVLALSNADEYLENLAEKGLESLARIEAAQQTLALDASPQAVAEVESNIGSRQ